MQDYFLFDLFAWVCPGRTCQRCGKIPPIGRSNDSRHSLNFGHLTRGNEKSSKANRKSSIGARSPSSICESHNQEHESVGGWVLARQMRWSFEWHNPDSCQPVDRQRNAWAVRNSFFHLKAGLPAWEFEAWPYEIRLIRSWLKANYLVQFAKKNCFKVNSFNCSRSEPSTL